MARAALTIRDVQVRAVRAPLRVPLVTAAGPLPNAALVLIDLRTTEGVVGRAYLMANAGVALRALAALVEDLGDTLKGQALVPADLAAQMRARFTLMGGARGMAGMAISGLDLAAWDACAIAAGVPLSALLGGSPRPLTAYDSLSMIPARDAENAVRKSLAAGFTAVKFKLGWPTVEEDLAVVRAFQAAAPHMKLMVDYNQSLDVAEAISRGQALDDLGLAWIEEPVRCDDFAGAARIKAALKTPLQIGENFSGVFDMEEALAANACDYVMPDVQHIGGVTGWMRAAAMAEAAGKPFSSHLFVEASAHLLTVTPTCHYLEFLDIAGSVLAAPPQVISGTVTASAEPGAGIAWDEAAVKRFCI